MRDPSFHFDCLPVQFEALLGNDEQEPQHAVTRAGVRAAREGKHGDDLRAHLLSLPTDNDVEFEGHETSTRAEG